ncbi:MAG: carboxylating nicotinate-nucleotide diphosphorylase [Candidatus Omnitrophota bacterium]|nr:carboxylating nicotinate-nucleotide diphosphorylase [Candidatus Omnitrophota bacterium]
MLKKEKVINFITNALNEDIGRIDLTTDFLIPSTARIKADIIVKSEGIIAGLSLIEIIYGILDRDIKVRYNTKEGAYVEPGKAICYLEGHAGPILKGERLVLNLLGRAGGIATATGRFVDKVRHYNADIMDTRKTTPNMRYIEKYAVTVGGGKNHRIGLYDQVLIKDNHLAVLKEIRPGSNASSIIENSVRNARKKARKNIKIEVEVKNIAEFEIALSSGADIIMLDNMLPDTVKEAVGIKNAGGSKQKQVLLEASGNITLGNVEEYAKTGVDRISVGAITHSSGSLDFSLDVI